ncbi:MAG: enoyl-CoA hydratase [Paracoccaceae bacterium]
MTDDILWQVEDGIGRITFNRPDRRNAFTLAMYARIAELCRKAPDEGARAIIMCGAGGKAFAAGTDMTEFRSFSTPEHALGYERNMDELLETVETCPLPTIAAITGACTGGGGAIAAACDLRICDARLKFGFPIARTLGNCLSIGNLARLSALIGPGRVREIIFTARLVGAEEALAAGLVSEVLEDAEAVMTRADELARTVAGHAPITLRATKEALRRLRSQGPGAEDGDLVALAYCSEDFREGMEAFLGKRPPEWKNR